MVLEVKGSFNAVTGSLEFQSLFCWMWFWKHCRFEPCQPHKLVSILILLDVVLEVSCSSPTDPLIIVSILILLDVVLEGCNCRFLQLGIWVSILILLDVVLEVFLMIICYLPRQEFQSLFCWMWFWKTNPSLTN